MQKTLLFIDKVSTFVGHAFSWFIVGLTLLVTWEVFSRYVLDNPHAWAFDAMAMLYGSLFMMAGAYTLAKNGHVRGDVLYGFFRPRTQATIDLILYIVFFLPGVFALTYAGYFYAEESWRINEHSTITYEGPPLYPFKTVIPVGLGLLIGLVTAALVIAQSDAPTAASDIAQCAAECRAHGATYVATADDPAEGDLLLEARRMAYPALERVGATLLDDVAVPIPALPAMLRAIADAADRHGVTIGTFGHAGDGNLHPTIVFDSGDEGRRTSTGWVARRRSQVPSRSPLSCGAASPMTTSCGSRPRSSSRRCCQSPR